MGIKERFSVFISYKHMSNRKFQESIGVSNSYIQNISKSISADVLQRIKIKYPELNDVWLLTGEGEMLKLKEAVKEDLSNPIKKKIPLYDDTVTVGGTNHLVANDNPMTTPSEWIDAGDWFPEATAAIRHYGDSMIEYPSGSILALKRVNDHRLIIWGRNYSIETTEFRITKRLQDGGDDYIMAYSSNVSTNPDGTLIHSPIRIPKDTIRHIDLVLGCVTKEYSNGPIKIIK